MRRWPLTYRQVQDFLSFPTKAGRIREGLPLADLMSINWPRFCEVIKDSRDILLTSHIRPDCDALGSELGMAGVLEALGKKVRIVNGHPTPPNLAFIDPTKRIGVIGQNVAVADLQSCDLMMILDTSAWAQLGA